MPPAAVSGIGGESTGLSASGIGMIYTDLDLVADRHRERLLAIEGVAGVEAHLEEGGFILVYVDGNVDQLRDSIPRELEGYRVEVRHLSERRPYYRIL